MLNNVKTDSEDDIVSIVTRCYEIIVADTRELAQISNSLINSSLSRYYYSIDEQGSTNIIIYKICL